MLLQPKIIGLLTLVMLTAACRAQGGLATRAQSKPVQQEPPAVVPHAAEDISGMYSFLQEGEFLQINLDREGVSGYVSRQGDLESDRGEKINLAPGNSEQAAWYVENLRNWSAAQKRLIVLRSYKHAEIRRPPRPGTR